MNEDVLKGMDESAKEARQEFMNSVVTGKAEDVAKWVAKYYKTAGYKRLCLILREVAE
jgi:hypothetical protein